MTQQAELLRKIDALPPQFFGEVIDFVGYLQTKVQQQTVQTETNMPKKRVRGCVKGEFRLEGDFSEPLKERVFGCVKGDYWMADDFCEPLEDFKDYM